MKPKRPQMGKIPFAETPTWDLIRDYIDKKRLPQRINKFGAASLSERISPESDN